MDKVQKAENEGDKANLEEVETDQKKQVEVSIEELKELNSIINKKLDSKDASMDQAIYSLLKVLESKIITRDLLVQSKIGKTMTRILDTKRDFSC
jgi:uncharacterized protein YcbK (DUF882 family)